jgi:hypothetical protein
MSVLRTLRKLVLGETWILPVGLAGVLAGALALRSVLAGGWEHLGGFALLAGIVAVLVLSVASSARPRR